MRRTIWHLEGTEIIDPAGVELAERRTWIGGDRPSDLEVEKARLEMAGRLIDPTFRFWSETVDPRTLDDL